MDISELYNKLDEIFVDYTTHQWKNGWQHEGDRLSKELTIQKNETWCNMFLLQIYNKEISLEGPQGFKIKVKRNQVNVRIAIESNNLNIFYYIDNELDWLASFDFITDLCQKVYDANVKIRESVSVVPKNLYGTLNPQFAKLFHREKQLNELGI